MMGTMIEWVDELSVGIQELDDQHQLLMNLLGQLQEATLMNMELAVIKEIFNEFIQQCQHQFMVEESLMRIFHYPDYPSHKAQHQDLLDNILAQQCRLMEADERFDPELTDFLEAWLIYHILDNDLAYLTHFVANGLTTGHNHIPRFQQPLQETLSKSVLWGRKKMPGSTH